VNKGIGCETCHGRVDRMPLMWQAQDLTMAWCLNCHRHPEQYVRPKERVFDMAYTPPVDQKALGAKLVKEYHIQSLTSCSTCHR
jgi:cytochrome c3-like protein